jgi:diguanylate cyclase (GGDEF)-like protein
MDAHASNVLNDVRVLVVDDDPVIRAVLDRFLTRRGAHVREATDALEAIRLLEVVEFDVVISDVQMPGHSGYWLRNEIHNRWPELPVILSSGAPPELPTMDGAEGELLLKPYEFADVDVRIARVLGRPSPTRDPEPVLVTAPETYKAVVEHLPAATYVSTIDRPWGDAYISPQITRMLGISQSEWLTDPNLPRRLVHPQDVERMIKSYTDFQNGAISLFRSEYRLLGANRRSVWVRHVARKAEDDARVYGLLLDVTDEMEAEEAIRTAALHDTSTGLYNRGGFYAVAEQQLRLAERYKTPLVLLIAEITRADAATRPPVEERERTATEAAQAFSESFRRSDVLGRTGPDQFAVLAIDTDLSNKEVLTQRLAENIRRAPANRLLSIQLTAAEFNPKSPASVQDLVASARHIPYPADWDSHNPN